MKIFSKHTDLHTIVSTFGITDIGLPLPPAWLPSLKSRDKSHSGIMYVRTQSWNLGPLTFSLSFPQRQKAQLDLWFIVGVDTLWPMGQIWPFAWFCK